MFFSATIRNSHKKTNREKIIVNQKNTNKFVFITLSSLYTAFFIYGSTIVYFSHYNYQNLNKKLVKVDEFKWVSHLLKLRLVTSL